jgi:hypothetical protein
MTRFVRTIVILTIAVRATASLPSYATQRSIARHGTSAYDGYWSVLLQTRRGNCPVALRAGVRILRGRVLTEDQSYALDGRVAPSGAVRVTISVGGRGGGAYGRLSRVAGHGRWRTWSGECSGEWTAARRD